MFDTANVCAEARYIINAMHGASKIKGKEKEKLSSTGHRFKVCVRERNVCEENTGAGGLLNWLFVAIVQRISALYIVNDY